MECRTKLAVRLAEGGAGVVRRCFFRYFYSRWEIGEWRKVNRGMKIRTGTKRMEHVRKEVH